MGESPAVAPAGGTRNLPDSSGQSVNVLTLDGTSYREHGVFHRGQQATSKLLADIAVSVDEVFDAK